MNLDDAFEGCLESLYEAALDDARWPAASALIDEACGVGGNALTVGEGSGGEDRIHFARLLYRGESRQDLVREYFEVHYPHGAGKPALEGQSTRPLRRDFAAAISPEGTSRSLANRKQLRSTYRVFTSVHGESGG